jgi:hypothetical protein
MDFEITLGCTCFSYTIDGTEIVDYENDDKLKEAIHALVDRCKDSSVLQDIFSNLVMSDTSTKYECSEEPCECCGDYVENYKLKI